MLAIEFEQAFGAEERKKLALLHLFQGSVDVNVLRAMGYPEAPWRLPELRGLTREEGIALLDRAAELGLLVTQGGGAYSIHPDLARFFQDLFQQSYPVEDLAAVRAFVETMGELGNYCFDQYEHGNRDVLAALRAEEANLLHACRLARAHGWWDRVISVMQGLRVLYDHTGRRADWKRQVEEIVPDFVDPADDGPLPGREDDWHLITEYRVLLAREERRWAEAERLQAVSVDRERERAAPVLARPTEELESDERDALRSLGATLHGLAQIRRELGRADCVAMYEEALELAERIGERAGAVACALNLGHAFKDLPALRDLDRAERWYRKSLDMCEEGDRLGRGRCLGQLGSIALERHREARSAGRKGKPLRRPLEEAMRLYHEVLDLLPPDAVNDLAVTHSQLGAAYGDAGNLRRAMKHYQEAIQQHESAGNLYAAAQTRFNLAIDLAGAGRRKEALKYAEAALRGFESYGEGAAKDIEDTRRLITEIRGR